MRRGTFFEINLRQLDENISHLHRLIKGNEILFMVKSDAYGHGLVEIVERAIEGSQVANFGVATIDEAIYLRRHLAKKECEIYVFSELNLEQEDCLEYYESFAIHPVISSLANLKLFLSLKQSGNIPLVLKVNIGMNRLGLRDFELEESLNLIKKAKRSVYHLMGHFSNATDITEVNSLQYKLFLDIKKSFKEWAISVERTSVSNSGAIEQGIGLNETHIRPGLMLFGPSGLSSKANGKVNRWRGESISRLQVKKISSYPVLSGQGVGYGLSPSPGDGILNLLAIGYGDGLPTSLANKPLRINGHDGQIVGRINMDLLQLLTKEDCPLNQREYIDLWHDKKSLMEICKVSKVIPYEMLCHISSRIPKKYVE